MVVTHETLDVCEVVKPMIEMIEPPARHRQFMMMKLLLMKKFMKESSNRLFWAHILVKNFICDI